MFKLSPKGRKSKSPKRKSRGMALEEDEASDDFTLASKLDSTTGPRINCNVYTDVENEEVIIAQSEESSGLSTKSSTKASEDTTNSEARDQLRFCDETESVSVSTSTASPYTNSTVTTFSKSAANTNATDSVFREKRPKAWWPKSPRNILPYKPKFQRFGFGEDGPIGIIQERRSEDDTSILATMDESREPHVQQQTTPSQTPQNPALHELCLTAPDPEQLWAGKSLVTPSSCTKTDVLGRLPMHCLSTNALLMDNMAFGNQDFPEKMGESSKEIMRTYTFDPDHLSSPVQDRLVDFVTQALLRAHPVAMISADSSGMIPFEAALFEWVNQTAVSDEKEPTIARERFTTIWRTSIKRIGQSFNSAASRSINSKRALGSPVNDLESARIADSKKQSNGMRLTASAFFAIQMLSAILDFLEVTAEERSRRSRNNSKRTDDNPWTSAIDRLHESTIHDISREVVRSIAGIPKLMYVVMLLEDTEQRNYVLNTKIMREVLASRSAVGEWLTEMLQSSDQRVADCAIEYLEFASNAIYGDSHDNHHRSFPKRNGSRKKKAIQDELAVEISNLKGFVPSLLSLSSRHVEEASTTKVVQRVLDEIMSRPFCITVVFCDAVFLVILIAGFRLAVNHLIVGSTPTQVLKYVYMANIGLFYFMQRELGRAVGLLAVTKHARVYFFSFWNVTDLLSILLSLASVIAIRRGLNDNEDQTDLSGIRNLLAVTTGFLWLRVLNFLKGVNVPLATFVLTVQQITKDVLWFCMIVLIMVIAFAQMFFTVLAPDSCSSDTHEEGEDSCKQSEYFLKTYMLLIFQEFDRSKFTTAFSVLLAVVYSFMVVLVMLNVLIAVASDSYEKCLVRSDSLFGRARVMLIAELVCFQNLLRPNSEDRKDSSAQLYKDWWSENWRVSGWSRASVVFFGLGTLWLFVWVIGELVVLFTGRFYGALGMSLVSIIITISLFFGILGFLSSEARIQGRRSADEEGNPESFCGGWLRRAMLQVLGSSRDSADTSEWKGRLLYLKEEMTRLSDESRMHADERMRSIEQGLQEDISDIKTNIASMGEEMRPDNEALHAALREVFHALKELETRVN